MFHVVKQRGKWHLMRHPSWFILYSLSGIFMLKYSMVKYFVSNKKVYKNRYEFMLQMNDASDVLKHKTYCYIINLAGHSLLSILTWKYQKVNTKWTMKDVSLGVTFPFVLRHETFLFTILWTGTHPVFTH
jgi:hypothetical protein